VKVSPQSTRSRLAGGHRKAAMLLIARKDPRRHPRGDAA
jgi:hypothetical protein